MMMIAYDGYDIVRSPPFDTYFSNNGNLRKLSQSGCSNAPIENVTSYTSPSISRCCSSFSHIWTQINTHK